MSKQERAIVLLSGGLDSATALAWSLHQGWDCHTLAFDYGQRHRIELAASANIAHSMGVQAHRVVQVDLRVTGGSALTEQIDVPNYAQHRHDAIPITYVPARNLIFLSIAAGLAETVAATHIVIGANVVDYSGYPDCRPEFLDAFTTTALLGTKAGSEGKHLEINAPLIQMGKSEIIALGLSLGVDYSLTRSCYNPDSTGMPCGQCDSCHFRLEGFAQLGHQDPLNYTAIVTKESNHDHH
ncbi:MAG: 7-cyano-7-deazaguanine synthase QueC [Zetaproteobacteria bacterium]|nr:7-cyano-7-deazaguanine synthase QueC [Zetaproteobacteria bacterium]